VIQAKLITELIKRFVLWQAVIFCSLFAVLASCRNDSLLGLELQPEGQFDTVQFLDSFTVQAFTIPGKSQRSDETQSYIGALQSYEFGYSISNLILNFDAETGLLSNTAGFNAIKIDSIVLQLRPIKIYGDATSEIPVEVLELNEPLTLLEEYFSDFEPDLKETILGSSVFKRPGQIKVTDSTIIESGVERERLPLVFRIRLENSFGQYLMENLGGGGWTSLNQLQTNFGGLMIRIPEGAKVDAGAVYSFALLTGESSILIYHTPADQQERLELPITSNCSRINQFSHDYSGSLVESYLNSSSNSQDLLFVQGMTGTKAQINIPGLQSFGQSQFSAIAKATLDFTLADEQPTFLGRSPRLFLLELEKDGTETLTPDFVESPSRANGIYSRLTNSYTFDVTQHVQRVTKAAQSGQNINYGLTLNAQVPVLNGNDTSHNVIQGVDNIMLKLYHTDLKN
tara:strand:- start:265 stop:1632 length:1368 start_codon:yes stop_codon:yes gene_type:complete